MGGRKSLVLRDFCDLGTLLLGSAGVPFLCMTELLESVIVNSFGYKKDIG